MRVLKLFLAALAAFLLSGCMALVAAPFANSLIDKPASLNYTTMVKKVPVFNAAVRALSQRGTTETIDRDTGTIKGTVTTTGGQTGYNVSIFVEEQGAKTSVRVQAKLEGVIKYDLKNSTDLANELVLEIERLIGSKLERT